VVHYRNRGDISGNGGVMSDNFHKNLNRRVDTIYNCCFNPELTSDEKRRWISKQLREAYRIGFDEGNGEVKREVKKR